MMAKTIRRLAALLCVCALLALTMIGCGDDNGKSEDEKSEKSSKLDKQLAVVMEDGRDFEKLDLTEFVLPDSVTAVYEEGHGLGYVVELTVNGYGEGMVILCGVSADGVVTGAECTQSNETIGEEKDYGDNFIGKDAPGVAAVDAIMGATLTTKAYKNAIKDALNTATILGGADIDLRSPEEILQNNLMAALPGSGNFSKIFLTEVVEGIDAIYQGSIGFVAVIGEEFIGIDTNGKVLDASVENAAAIEAEMGKVISALSTSNLIGVDLTAYEGIHETVQRVTKTASGNYIIEIKGAGYGINGGDEYHPASGVPIVIRVSMTADGKIIDCLTVSQQETDGIGSVCGDEEFSSRFDGKTAETYQEVDGIAGATITTNGYLKAIERCFEAVAILEGGAK